MEERERRKWRRLYDSASSALQSDIKMEKNATHLILETFSKAARLLLPGDAIHPKTAAAWPGPTLGGSLVEV